MQKVKMLFLLGVVMIAAFGVVQITTAADFPYCYLACGPGECSGQKCTCPPGSSQNAGLATDCYSEAHGFCGEQRWCIGD
jgi:hypothetical protein